jgi:hypothetical protein
MVTPSISNPYRILAAYALRKPPEVLPDSVIFEARKRAHQIRDSDPPLLTRFLGFYTDVEPHVKVTTEDTERAEKLLRCIWRGEVDDTYDPIPGRYQHFKGSFYTVQSTALLLEGPKEELAVVYGNDEGTFVRPLREWVELVVWPDGEYHPRFRKTTGIP